MIQTVVKITCEWCAEFQECSIKGTGEKRLRAKAAKWGWIKLIGGNGAIHDFCSKECYDFYKNDKLKF